MRVAEVPAAVVTVTSTTPVGAVGGLMTTMVPFVSLTMVAAVLPKSTAVAFSSPPPVIVTVCAAGSQPVRGSDGAYRRRGRGQQEGSDRRGLVAAVLVRRLALGGVGKVTREVGGGYRVSPRIAGQRRGVEDRRGALEGRAVVVVVAIEEAHADRGQSAAAVVLRRAGESPAPVERAGGKVAGRATDVVVTLSFPNASVAPASTR